MDRTVNGAATSGTAPSGEVTVTINNEDTITPPGSTRIVGSTGEHFIVQDANTGGYSYIKR
jgi:hypothetical protein